MNIRHPNFRTVNLLIITAFAVALIGGCKNKDSQVIGKWTDAKNTTITFGADHTFSEGTGANSAAGKWSIDDKKVAVEIETIGGKPAAETIDKIIAMVTKMNPKAATPDQIAKMRAQTKANFTLSDDAKTMTLVGAPAGAQAGPNITLTKVETK